MMTRPNTHQAVREIIYDALTTPPLQWSIDGGPTNTLPVENVVPKSVWLAGGTPPMPLVAFTVSLAVPTSRYLWGEQNLTLKLWVVSSLGEDEITQIFAAIKARLDFADQDGLGDLSRVASGSKLGAMLRLIEPTRVSEPGYERETSRWYLVAEYRIAAI